jgi:hypothetical protein
MAIKRSVHRPQPYMLPVKMFEARAKNSIEAVKGIRSDSPWTWERARILPPAIGRKIR